MDLAIESVHDIIRILNAYPQWQQEIRDSLFPEVDFPKAFRELAEAQRRTEQTVRDLSQSVQGLLEAQRRTEQSLRELSQTVRELSEDQRRTEQTVRDLSQTVRDLSQTVQEMAKENRKSQLLLKHHTTQIARLNNKMVEAARERQVIRDDLAVLKRGQDDLRHGQNELRREVKELRHNQNDLRGHTYEYRVRDRADAVFGRFLTRGRKMRNKIGVYLQKAEENGQISDPEHDQVLACDLLWGGKLKSNNEELFLVVEASWSAEATDIERAIQRAAILRSIGLNVVPVVAAIQWTPEMAEQALNLGVVMVDDLRLDRETWEGALALVV